MPLELWVHLPQNKTSYRLVKNRSHIHIHKLYRYRELLEIAVSTFSTKHRKAVEWAGEARTVQLQGSLPYWLSVAWTQTTPRSFAGVIICCFISCMVGKIIEFALRLVLLQRAPAFSAGNCGVLTTSVRWGARWRPPPPIQSNPQLRSWYQVFSWIKASCTVHHLNHMFSIKNNLCTAWASALRSDSNLGRGLA